jgi:hypothetical protein
VQDHLGGKLDERRRDGGRVLRGDQDTCPFVAHLTDNFDEACDQVLAFDVLVSLIENNKFVKGFWCKLFEVRKSRWRDCGGDYAATTVAQIAGIVAGRPGSLPTLNCCFLIFAASSIPLIVIAAASKRLNPSIGRIRCFMRR